MKLRFASDILRRLGEELNPSFDKGIMELVKNAYDADAVDCTVILLNTDEPGGTITVEDNGAGMTAEDIEQGWLVIGRSTKQASAKTALGRTPAGSKGLGRLAALRMGSRAFLTTRPSKLKPLEYNMLIDWDSFKGVNLVDDVELELEESRRRAGDKDGTIVRIENVRSRVGRREVRKLARELILLADPFGDTPSGFKPVLRSEDFQDLERLVSAKYFSEAEYHLVSSLDALGRANARVEDWKGQVLYEADHTRIAVRREGRTYETPEVTFELWVFILSKQGFSYRGSALSDVKDWLKEFGGAHVYYNSIRVSPYGDPGNDWLDMNLSRARSPEEKPSTNTSIGRVSIHDDDGALSQKTDRSGFIESEAFVDLKAFCQDALAWMASRRLEEAEKKRRAKRAEHPRQILKAKQQLDRAVEKLPPKLKDPIRKAVDQAWGTVSREVEGYQREIQLYRTLSTAGITAATFAHEASGNPLKSLNQSLAALTRRIAQLPGGEPPELRRPLESAVIATRGLSVLGDATLHLLEHEKRRVGRVDVHSVLTGILDTFRPFLDSRGIAVDTVLFGASPFMRASEAALESIFTNLINNSVAALEKARTDQRRILFRTAVVASEIEIRVEDNGPGIVGIDLAEIWLPGRTTKANGTGLGLTIVKDTVEDMGGTVEAEMHGSLGGAAFVIRLPIVGM